VALEPNPDDTWLLAGSVADEAPDDGPAHRGRHAQSDRSSLISLGKGVAAVIGGCAAVALVVLVLGLGRSSPSSHRPTGERGLVAALPSAPGSSAAPSTTDHTSTKPSRSASPSPSATHPPPSTSSASHAVTRSSPAQAVPPPRTTSRTHAPSPSPRPSTSHLTYTIPGHNMTGTITISMPNGWSITGSSGAVSRNGNTWHVVFSQLTVSVAGPSGSHKTMTATIDPVLQGTTVQTYSLN
jgi:hypothetical protein